MRSSDVMRAWFQRVWCERDASAIDDLLHPEAEVFGLGPDPVIGPDGFRGLWEGMRDAFAATHVEVIDAVDGADDGTDTARAWVRCKGTLTLDGRPIPLEGGRPVRGRGREDHAVLELLGLHRIPGCHGAPAR